MKKLLGMSIAVITATLLLSGCSNKEETLAKMQDRNVDQMTKVNQMQEAELKRLSKRVQELEKQNNELRTKLLQSKPSQEK